MAVAAAVSASVPAAADPTTADEEPLRTAGRAAEHVSFVGVLRMRWSEQGVDHNETVLVQGADGAVVVRGATAVMALPRNRLVQHGQQWDLLWPVPREGQDRPEASAKYQLTSGAPAQVAGRSSRMIEVRDDGMLLERLYLDAETGLLLRREQFEKGTGPTRSIGFEAVVIGSASEAPRPPVSVVDAAPRLVAATQLPDRLSAPPQLPDGYRRVGVYRRSGVTQVLYSDGLYELSVFQQEGRLDRSGLPAGDQVSLRGKRGWHDVWPGGHVVVWQAGGLVHTAVSDAPMDQVLAAVRALPVVQRSPSLLERLRGVCRSLVQPLAD